MFRCCLRVGKGSCKYKSVVCCVKGLPDLLSLAHVGLDLIYLYDDRGPIHSLREGRPERRHHDLAGLRTDCAPQRRHDGTDDARS